MIKYILRTKMTSPIFSILFYVANPHLYPSGNVINNAGLKCPAKTSTAHGQHWQRQHAQYLILSLIFKVWITMYVSLFQACAYEYTGVVISPRGFIHVVRHRRCKRISQSVGLFHAVSTCEAITPYRGVRQLMNSAYIWLAGARDAKQLRGLHIWIHRAVSGLFYKRDATGRLNVVIV